MENKAFKEDGSPCRLPIAAHGVTYCALLFVVILLSFAAVPVSAESPHTVTVSMRPSKGARTVVAVKLNGAGPYDFMVDTGATVTVLDTALFDELGLPAEGSSRITSSAGVTHQIRSVVKEVALDCLSAQNIVVVSMKSPVAGSDYRAVRGILGENFLRHFDILFDNQHRKMTLDAVADLADSLAGERLPITFPPLPRDDENRYRPMISVKVEASGQASVLLDSAATEIFKQIFISHAGSYAIINPAKRSSVAAALAIVTPLQQ